MTFDDLLGGRSHGPIPDGRWKTMAPADVKVYVSTLDYIDEEPRRASHRFKVEGDLAGWEVTDGFRLYEDKHLREPRDSEWRISVNEELREVYAVCRRFPLDTLYTFTGPVWLIEQVPPSVNPTVFGELLGLVMRDVERLRDEDDSLLLATELIRRRFNEIREGESE